MQELNVMMSLVVTIFCILLIINLLFNHLFHDKSTFKPPPGPRRLPIIGNLHMLGKLPHRNFAKLAQKYGPIMSLKLGSVPVIIVSSPKAVESFLKQNDAIFASRPTNEAANLLSYGASGIAFTPYGDYWRHAKKICTQQLLTPAKVQEFRELRMSEIESAIWKIRQSAISSEIVNLDKLVTELIEDITFKMVVGKGMKEDKRFDLKSVVNEGLALFGAFNIADFIPILGLFDLQGLRKRMKVVAKKIDEILEHIIEDHLREEDLEQHKDLVTTLLLSMNKPDSNNNLISLGRDNVKAIIFDTFVGGIDTSAVTITWALSALLKNTRAMKTLQGELDVVIGRGRMINESDLPKLSYLDMVVKETFRLYPVGSLVLPYESLEDVVINGYMIRKRSRLLVNAWAIGRDPTIWSQNVEEFYPERFMYKDVDIRGRDLELIPFGAGRRGCPGINLGLITVKLILAQLVHCFDWKLPNDMVPQELDMNEKFGLAMRREKELLATPSFRLKENNKET